MSATLSTDRYPVLFFNFAAEIILRFPVHLFGQLSRRRFYIYRLGRILLDDLLQKRRLCWFEAVILIYFVRNCCTRSQVSCRVDSIPVRNVIPFQLVEKVLFAFSQIVYRIYFYLDEFSGLYLVEKKTLDHQR